MATKTFPKCPNCEHDIYLHTFSEDFQGCDEVKCGCSLNLGDYIAALEARLKEAEAVIKSGQVLVLKMWEVYDEPQYQVAFSLLLDHQGKYSGKTWSKEQDDFSSRAAEFLKGATEQIP